MNFHRDLSYTYQPFFVDKDSCLVHPLLFRWRVYWRPLVPLYHHEVWTNRLTRCSAQKRWVFYRCSGGSRNFYKKCMDERVIRDTSIDSLHVFWGLRVMLGNALLGSKGKCQLLIKWNRIDMDPCKDKPCIDTNLHICTCVIPCTYMYKLKAV